MSLGVLFDHTVSRNVCMVHGETKAQPARENPCLGMPLVLRFLFQNCNLNAADVIPSSEQAFDLHGRAEGGAAVVKASLALIPGEKKTLFSLKTLSLLRKRKGVGIRVADLNRFSSLL